MGSLLKKVAGAICTVDGKVVLVSDDDGNTWRIPRTVQESDDNLKKQAEDIAWNEAGVLGYAADKRVGEFLYSENGKMYQVSVFSLEARKYRDKWPQSEHLKRSRFSFDEAVLKVSEFGLRDIFEKLARRKS